MYKCKITNANKNNDETINNEKYFISNNHNGDIKNDDDTCYILKNLQFIDAEKLNFYNLKKIIGPKGTKLTSFRSDYTDKHKDYLKNMFDYIEDVFIKDGSNQLKFIDDEFKSIDKELCDILPKYKQVLVKQRIGQGKWRDYLIENNHCKCVLCEISMKELLIASHIKEYSKCEKNTMEHLDIKNGLLLCANHDKLFDKHLISFNIDGKIIISDKVPKSDYKMLEINMFTIISDELFDEKYMSYHRNIFKKINTDNLKIKV
ncbi:HNH endonuclease [Clostridium estertheticum]|uniref:HNH endonuclease n=1 Tax=Clostridium estertheticum TaxID=238834 RepID=UPI001C0BD4E2|nr:HNH endonuclease [Clostridium estertheticum]MBU3179117.1 HNH endonuclease [Clostridium estertheticum]